METAELRNRFEYHPPTASKAFAHGSVRTNVFELADWFNEVLPEGREKALVMTKLEEVMFWANAALARN